MSYSGRGIVYRFLAFIYIFVHFPSFGYNFPLKWVYCETTFHTKYFVLSYLIDVVSTLSYWVVCLSNNDYFLPKLQGKVRNDHMLNVPSIFKYTEQASIADQREDRLRQTGRWIYFKWDGCIYVGMPTTSHLNTFMDIVWRLSVIR